MMAVAFEPLTDDEQRIVASLYPRLSPAVALATYRAWVAQGFEELADATISSPLRWYPRSWGRGVSTLPHLSPECAAVESLASRPTRDVG